MEIHSFRVDIATKYGIAEAILLGYFYHWITVHEKNETNFYDGRYWTYDTVRGLVDKMPYFARSTIHRAIKKLTDNNLLITGNFNRLSYDRTTWYTLTDYGLSLFEEGIPCPKMKQGLSQNGTTIPIYNEENGGSLSQNGTGLSQNGTGLSQNGTTIPIQSTYSLDDEEDIKQKIPGNKYPKEIYQKACAVYEKFIMPIPSTGIKESILSCVDDYGLSKFGEAVKTAAKNNARSFSYIEACLKNAESGGNRNDKPRVKKNSKNNRVKEGCTSECFGNYI